MANLGKMFNSNAALIIFTILYIVSLFVIQYFCFPCSEIDPSDQIVDNVLLAFVGLFFLVAALQSIGDVNYLKIYPLFILFFWVENAIIFEYYAKDISSCVVSTDDYFSDLYFFSYSFADLCEWSIIPTLIWGVIFYINIERLGAPRGEHD